MGPPNDRSLPDIPEDVCRLIFEIATEEAMCKPTYALISKQVQSWVELLVYRKVVPSELFYRTIMDPESSKPPNFFATHVKSLMFEVQGDDFVAEILGKCVSVQALALWYGSTPDAPATRRVLTTPGLLSPTHLSLSRFLFNQAGDAFSYSIFAHVTHLDLSCPHGEDDWPWSSLGGLEHLTHLNVDIYFKMKDPIRLAKFILSSCSPTFRVLIMSTCDSPDAATAILKSLRALCKGEIDSRVVVAAYSTEWTSLVGECVNMIMVYDELMRAWTVSSLGNQFWTRAEQITQDRQDHLLECRPRLAVDIGGHSNRQADASFSNPQPPYL